MYTLIPVQQKKDEYFWNIIRNENYFNKDFFQLIRNIFFIEFNNLKILSNHHRLPAPPPIILYPISE